MLLDDLMPEHDVRTSHAVRVAAPQERVYACLRTTDFDHWGITRALYALRMVPALLVAPRETWRRLSVARGQPHLTHDDILASGFTVLGERPGEELVLGTVGRFWRASSELRPVSPASFREPAPPGSAKAAWSFTVTRRPGGTELGTETRVLCADAAVRRRFRAYWLVIRPFSGLIRREMLAAVRSAAESDRRGR